MSGGFMPSDYDPYMLAELVGQQYNPYQGYPLKQVSDQIWDVYGPTPDYLIAQMASQMNPNPDQFSTDTFFGGDPLLRGPLAEALANSRGDTIGAYNYLQDPEFTKRLTKQIGRTEWDALAARGDLASLGAVTGEEKDKAALDYYQRGLEDLMAQGAPSRNRQLSNLDYIREREGGLAKPGTGTYPDSGAGGGGGNDPLGRLAMARGIDLTATPEGTPFGQGLQEVGMGGGPDRLAFENGQRVAVIGGRKFALPDTMAGPTGTNPAYQRGLQAVMLDKRRREAGAKKDQNKKKNLDEKMSWLGRQWETVRNMGTLI